MAREGPAGIDINFPPLYFTEAGSQLQGQAIHTMSVPNLIPSDSWCQRVVHTKYRPLPILAALDESICLNSLSNHLANPECGNQLECRWVQRSMAEPQGTIQKTAVQLHMIESVLATQ